MKSFDVWGYDHTIREHLGYVEHDYDEDQGWVWIARRSIHPTRITGLSNVVLGYYDTPEDAEEAIREFWRDDE